MTENKNSARSAERLTKKRRFFDGLGVGLAVFAVLTISEPVFSRALAVHPDSGGWIIALVVAKAVLAALVAGGAVKVLGSNGRKKQS